ncbi:Uncharacterized protein M6B38_218230 [Iris pallida]|uniref:Aminotransferase-like plant mobile domain-containing protein n=1 Tax=Iris pallida TaxID=29817 RepID=A0AAX6DX75_IRIPA|nr:Uncharacterized protein M6B38_218230 [Iris pallida]
MTEIDDYRMIVWQTCFSEKNSLMNILVTYRNGWRAPCIINRAYIFEEPRFKSKAIDEPSLRAFADDISEAVIYCTRAYLLCLCGALLFFDATKNMINVRLLPFLQDLGTRTKHAWGAAVLAHLYHSMTSFVTKVSGGKTAKNISGCVTLIQVFWQPQSVSEDVINSIRGMSLHRYYIMYNENIMFHPADRVMRQFGLKQRIPLDPLSSSIFKANIEDRAAHFLVGW